MVSMVRTSGTTTCASTLQMALRMGSAIAAGSFSVRMTKVPLSLEREVSGTYTMETGGSLKSIARTSPTTPMTWKSGSSGSPRWKYWPTGFRSPHAALAPRAERNLHRLKVTRAQPAIFSKGPSEEWTRIGGDRDDIAPAVAIERENADDAGGTHPRKLA